MELLCNYGEHYEKIRLRKGYALSDEKSDSDYSSKLRRNGDELRELIDVVLRMNFHQLRETFDFVSEVATISIAQADEKFCRERWVARSRLVTVLDLLGNQIIETASGESDKKV